MTRKQFLISSVLLSSTMVVLILSRGNNRPADYLGRQNAADKAFLRGDYDEAIKQHEANLTEAEKNGDARQMAFTLHWLAPIYQSQERYAEAESAFKREIAAAERSDGAQHPFMLYSLTDITMFYLSQDRETDAKPYSSRAISIVEGGVGQEYAAIAEVAKKLALQIAESQSSQRQ